MLLSRGFRLRMLEERAIQRSLMPQDVLRIAGYSVDYRSEACVEVGGDSVDILKREDGRCMLLVADGAGKGLASSRYCAEVCTSTSLTLAVWPG